MKRSRAYTLLMAAALSVLPACEKDGSAGRREAVPVQLALSVGSRAKATKGNPAVITEMSKDNVVFRGMTGVTILPFDVSRAIGAGDQSVFHPSYMDDISSSVYDQAVLPGGDYISGIVGNNWAHIYPTGEVSLPKGTASVLVYGYAPEAQVGDEIRSRHLNGALEATGLGEQASLRYAGNIHFDPVPILSGGLPEAAQDLADVLNAILVPAAPAHEIEFSTTLWYQDGSEWHEAPISVAWNEEVEDLVLRECYRETVNGGNLTPGSGRSVEYMVSRLYRRLKTYVVENNSPVEYTHGGTVYPAMTTEGGTIPLTWGYLLNGLRNILTGRIEALDGNALTINPSNYEITLTDAALRNYPGSLGLPDGAAILRWSGTRFYPVADMTGDSEEGVAPVTSYCYPPRLWYFANSTLSTSSTDKSGAYTATKMTMEEKTWADIIGEYRFGKIVSGNTESVALDEPLQFSCGMLYATVTATTEVLDDGDGTPGTTVPVGDGSFPVTGVIIGSQQRLNFDFTPAGGRDYFLYDDCLSGVSLPAPPNAPGQFYSFVSETPAGQDVYLCLELRNDSGQSFTGADGVVLPGSKFYLVGSIEAPSAVEGVFQQDHATTIHCTVSSLKNALNAIPNLERPHIALGILISANWTMSTPGHVILS